MPITNPKDFLVDAVKYPSAIEAVIPAGAPKLSEMMADIAAKVPELTNFPVELPDLPAPPELPEMPTPPGGGELRRVISGVEVTPITGAAAAPRPTAAVATRGSL